MVKLMVKPMDQQTCSNYDSDYSGAKGPSWSPILGDPMAQHDISMELQVVGMLHLVG